MPSAHDDENVGAATAAGRSEPLIQMSLLGEAVEHAPVGIFVFDDEGRYVAVNAYACELLGYSVRSCSSGG